MADDLTLRRLHEDLANDLERIAARFKTRPKITLMIRQPYLPDGDVCLSDDNTEEAIAAILKIRAPGAAYYIAGPDEPPRDPDEKEAPHA